MLYTKREQLTVIEMKENVESVPMEEVKRVLVNRPSNMIYCIMQGRVLGIISTGDIYRADMKNLNRVKINKKFTYVYAGEYMKARNIFKEKGNINALPVISKEGILIGEYTRWDDLVLLENILGVGEIDNTINLNTENKIVLIRPAGIFADKQRIFERFKQRLAEQGVEIQCVCCSEVFQGLESVDMVLVVDENETRAWKILFGMKYKYKNKIPEVCSYRNVIMEQVDFSDMQRAAYIGNLSDRGIHVVGLTFEGSSYCEQLKEKIWDKYAAIGKEPCNKLYEPMYKDFFDDLYSEEYVCEILGIPYAFENNGGVLSLKDCRSKYYNVTNGERSTVGQPENHDKNIYFFGACYIYGHWVEDKNTIESFLQKRLCKSGKAVRVVNCGSLGMEINHRYLARIMATDLRKGDIIVIGSLPKGIKNVVYLDLNKALEKHQVDAGWLIDWSAHCNHKVNKLYADYIYDALKPIFSEKVESQGMSVEKDGNLIRFLYLDHYFKDFNSSAYGKIGSIVANCNPFTYGHRYLIEQALTMVDFLIIFIVEEERSAFSFVERLIMAREGISDLKNVMAVPSGPFILSQMSFPEYFVKETSDSLVEHTEQDIITFAEKIAPQLGIRYRFVGEEPEDNVTNQYNQAMKKILPQYGIKLIEIPRKMINGKYVSASSARKFMEENAEKYLPELLPGTTRRLIGIG